MRLTITITIWNKRTWKVAITLVTAGISHHCYWKARFYLSGKISKMRKRRQVFQQERSSELCLSSGNPTESKQCLQSWILVASRKSMGFFKMHSSVVQPTTCQGIPRGRWLPKGIGTDSVSVKDALILLYTKLFFIGCSSLLIFLARNGTGFSIPWSTNYINKHARSSPTAQRSNKDWNCKQTNLNFSKIIWQVSSSKKRL